MFRYFFYRLCGGVLLCISFIVPRAEAELSCKIDGEEVTFELAYWDDRLSPAGPVGVIQGTDVDGKARLSITVGGHFDSTTYTFSSDQASPNRAIVLDGSLGILFESRSGTLSVTSKQERLAGHFAITLAGETGEGEEMVIAMTEGIFDVSREPASTTTSTAPPQLCPAELIFGAGSAEVHRLRTLRDAVLSATPEGREVIRLYYQWGGLLVEALQGDSSFQQRVREVVEAMLPGVCGVPPPGFKH